MEERGKESERGHNAVLLKKRDKLSDGRTQQAVHHRAA